MDVVEGWNGTSEFFPGKRGRPNGAPALSLSLFFSLINIMNPVSGLWWWMDAASRRIKCTKVQQNEETATGNGGKNGKMATKTHCWRQKACVKMKGIVFEKYPWWIKRSLVRFCRGMLLWNRFRLILIFGLNWKKCSLSMTTHVKTFSGARTQITVKNPMTHKNFLKIFPNYILYIIYKK